MQNDRINPYVRDIATIWCYEQSNSALFDWGSLTKVQLGISKDKCRMAVSRQRRFDFDHLSEVDVCGFRRWGEKAVT